MHDGYALQNCARRSLTGYEPNETGFVPRLQFGFGAPCRLPASAGQIRACMHAFTRAHIPLRLGVLLLHSKLILAVVKSIEPAGFEHLVSRRAPDGEGAIAVVQKWREGTHPKQGGSAVPQVNNQFASTSKEENLLPAPTRSCNVRVDRSDRGYANQECSTAQNNRWFFSLYSENPFTAPCRHIPWTFGR